MTEGKKPERIPGEHEPRESNEPVPITVGAASEEFQNWYRLHRNGKHGFKIVGFEPGAFDTRRKHW